MAKNANPRKRPRQDRAKATVDAILTAAAQVLIAQGYEGATTARIAERAGVSIGSLYQYFPNKEALVAALIEHHAEEIVAMVEEAFTASKHATIADGMKSFIHAAVTAHRLDPKLHKILNEQVPRVGRLGKALDTSRRVTEAIEGFLRAHKAELNPKRDPTMAALVVETALESLAHKAVIERRDLLQGGVFEREMLTLVTGYLTSR